MSRKRMRADFPVHHSHPSQIFHPQRLQPLRCSCILTRYLWYPAFLLSAASTNAGQLGGPGSLNSTGQTCGIATA